METILRQGNVIELPELRIAENLQKVTENCEGKVVDMEFYLANKLSAKSLFEGVAIKKTEETIVKEDDTKVKTKMSLKDKLFALGFVAMVVLYL